MNVLSQPRHSTAADAVYGLLNPVPFGLFVGGFIFDVVYARTGELMWGKSAAWLIALGLVFALIPRLINLTQVWFTSRSAASRADRIDFWLNLLAIAAAIANSFVHSRDAYGVVPAGVLLSACTVILLATGQMAVAVQRNPVRSPLHA